MKKFMLISGVPETWDQLSIEEQMGNIGSEVGRALAAKRRGDEARMMGALYRGVDLLNATVMVWLQRKSPRVQEILTAREQFKEAILTDKDDPKLEDYFMWFAFVARSNR